MCRAVSVDDALGVCGATVVVPAVVIVIVLMELLNLGCGSYERQDAGVHFRLVLCASVGVLGATRLHIRLIVVSAGSF
eukprot:m.186054 g.186054  ORF g.186054 m.186054 type:complete len:78 (-) comp18491_c1_seq67:3982-4215(-)